MRDSVRNPKQMVSYDRFAISGGGYTPDDDDYCYYEASEETCENPLQDLESCAYCSTKLIKIENNIVQESSYRDFCLWYCRRCRFWQARLYSDPHGRCMPPPEEWAYISKLREFNPSMPDCCSKQLALYIRSHPHFLYSCAPQRFEKFVADVFRANYANVEVVHVGRPGDGGIDVLLIDAEDEKWLIQVKRRESQDYSEGVSTIRDMLGAMVVKNALKGIVVSTAERFTRDAKRAVAAASAGQHRMTVRLVDRGIFDKMLDPILPDRPWLLPIWQLDTEIAKHLAHRIRSDHQLDLFTAPPSL